MNTDKEYKTWKTDPASQQEYKEYLFKEIFQTPPITDPTVQPFLEQFTCQFNEIFRKKP
jgi:hypothetical protein